MFRINLYPTYQVFSTAVIALIMTAILAPLWIKILKSRRIGQMIRSDGPVSHQVKAGTPTMGGVLIVFVVIISYLIMADVSIYSVLAVLITYCCGALGFIDDFSKVVNARSLGLKARTKLGWEVIIALVIGIVAVKFAGVSTDVAIPLTNINLKMGWLYLIFIFIIISGTSNSVNLTDGLDGLAAGTVTIVMLAYAGIAFRQDHLDLAIFCAAVGGACVGFLWYNSYPADIFMGDTGSLGLGGAIASLAILTKTEFLLVLIGGIYVIESLSVISQVATFKLFNKRIWKMAPIHHHFEILGWSETKIMIRFWIVTGIMAGIGFALYFQASL